jgi:hypothetical protein
VKVATEKFKQGQRVRVSEKGEAAGIDGLRVKRPFGIVKGFPARIDYGDPRVLVYVQRDGDRSKRCYHMDFWEPDDQV